MFGCDCEMLHYLIVCIYIYTIYISGWWFGTFLIFHILGTIIPTDYYVSEGLKPPTTHTHIYIYTIYIYIHIYIFINKTYINIYIYIYTHTYIYIRHMYICIVKLYSVHTHSVYATKEVQSQTSDIMDR